MTYPYQAALFAERNKNLVYQAVIAALEKAARENAVTRRQIASAIGRKPSQVSKWLSGPSNWTLDTVSDLLFAVDATMDYRVVFNKDQPQTSKGRMKLPPPAIQAEPARKARERAAA